MRLATGVWISGLIRRCFAAGGAAVVRQRGDAHAGTILLVDRRATGAVHLHQMIRTSGGRLGFTEIERNGGWSEADADAFCARQQAFDRDLWVVEVEQVDLPDLLTAQPLE